VKVPSLPKDEAKFADLIQNELCSHNIRCKRDSLGNLISFLKGNCKGAPCILLNAHMDTVSPGENIKPKRRYGVITSDQKTILGADNKAGVAVIMEIVEVLKEKMIPHGDIQIIFTVQEEIGLKGARAIKKQHIKADFGYVLDGGDVDVVHLRAPSQYNLFVEIIGRAAHAGMHPEQGINAIQVASRAIAKMKIGRIDSETTANIGVIHGGRATNIVPEKVEIKGEVRSHNPRKLKAELKHIQKCFSSECFKAKAQLKMKADNVYNSFSLKKEDKVYKIAENAFRRMKIKPILKPTGGGSDANIFNEMGIPSIIMGMGADRIHTKQERISEKDLLSAARILLEIIKESCERKNAKK